MKSLIITLVGLGIGITSFAQENRVQKLYEKATGDFQFSVFKLVNNSDLNCKDGNDPIEVDQINRYGKSSKHIGCGQLNLAFIKLMPDYLNGVYAINWQNQSKIYVVNNQEKSELQFYMSAEKRTFISLNKEGQLLNKVEYFPSQQIIAFNGWKEIILKNKISNISIFESTDSQNETQCPSDTKMLRSSESHNHDVVIGCGKINESSDGRIKVIYKGEVEIRNLFTGELIRKAVNH